MSRPCTWAGLVLVLGVVLGYASQLRLILGLAA